MVCPPRLSVRQAAWAMAWLKLCRSGCARMTEISIDKGQHNTDFSGFAQAGNPTRSEAHTARPCILLGARGVTLLLTILKAIHQIFNLYACDVDHSESYF